MLIDSPTEISRADASLPTEAKALLDERQAARDRKDFKRSDELRVELEKRFGIRVKDTKDGQRWERDGRRGA